MKTKECEKLIFAVMDNDDLKMIKHLVKSDSNSIKCLGDFERTALMYATREEHYEVAKYLIEVGADVNAKDVKDWRPIHFASRENAFSIIKLLVENGATVDAQESNGNTALLNTVYNEEIRNYLLANGADIKLKNFHGVSAEDMLNY